MKNYVRWYDKDPELSRFMAFLENLDEDIREEIAQDLIQILMSELKTNKDSEIFMLAQNKINEYKRWYDSDLMLHSAIEIIKNLTEEERKEILPLLMESIVQILTEHSIENDEDE